MKYTWNGNADDVPLFISTSDAQAPSYSTLGITSVSIRFRERESLYVSPSTPISATHSARFKRVRDGAD